MTYQFGWNKGQQSDWQKQNLTLSHLHSGNSCFLRQFLLVMSRSDLPGGFAGQQGEFAVAVVHQVQNRVVTCFTRILHNSATNLIASLYHKASPRVLIRVLLVVSTVACLSFTVRNCLYHNLRVLAHALLKMYIFSASVRFQQKGLTRIIYDLIYYKCR